MASGQSNAGYQSDAVRYTSPSHIDKLQGDVDEVAGIMKTNIKSVLDRGEKLDNLEARTEALNDNARQFQYGAKQVKNKFWWKNVKMWICIILIVAVVIAVIVLAVVFGTKNKT